jgi:hypothetical protein
MSARRLPSGSRKKAIHRSWSGIFAIRCGLASKGEVCHRRFTVRYELGAPRVPSYGADRVHVRAMRCPSCGHLNPLVRLMYAQHVVVKSVPGPQPMCVRARPNTLRRLLSRFRPLRP